MNGEIEENSWFLAEKVRKAQLPEHDGIPLVILLMLDAV